MRTNTFKSEYIEGSTAKVTVFRESVKFEFGSGHVSEMPYYNPRDLRNIEARLEDDFMSYYWAEKIVKWISYK